MAEEKIKHRPLSTSEQEIALLKGVFADNEPLLKSVRALLLGFPIQKTDADLVKSAFKNPEIKLALRKKMYPVMSPDSPIGEESDFWFGTETEVIGKDVDTIKQVVDSKNKTLELYEQAFKLLDNPFGEQMDLAYEPDTKTDPLQIWLLARNKYIKGIVTGLAILKVIAGQKSETPEQAMDRLIKDSSK